MAIVAKKLINLPENAVDESLIGFCASNPNAKKLKNYRVIVRADLKTFKTSNKVALISGGGSGHEPIFVGFVGKGCLTACVAGSVFTSPPPSHILAALSSVDNPAGILVFIINYTGDRLNFGIAIERYQSHSNLKQDSDSNLANSKQKMIKSITIADDCALTSPDRSAGRRGLAGTLFVLKICGAMAEKGSSLDEIYETAEILVKNMGTIGISLSSCSVPGSGPTFQLAQDEMELGLGIHGEPGVKRIKLVQVKEAVRIMVDHMTDKQSATHLTLANHDNVSVIINNLGGMSQIEMNIVTKEVIEYLSALNVNIKRIYVGTFMTSLEMHGVSVSILKVVSDDWLTCLDTEVDCAGWPYKPVQKVDTCITTGHCEIDPEFIDFSSKGQRKAQKGINVNTDVGKCLLEICEILQANENYLNELDGYCGDGDCGSTIKRGASAIKEALVSNDLSDNPSKLFLQLAEIWESNTGGTAGAIYSLFLSAASKSVIQNQQSVVTLHPKIWTHALIAGTEAIMHYGGAQPGDRTMIDPLYAAKEYIEKHLAEFDKKEISHDFLANFLKVIKDAAKNTKNMAAKAGRASYVGSQNLTHPDPGAMAVYFWMKAILDYLLKQ